MLQNHLFSFLKVLTLTPNPNPKGLCAFFVHIPNLQNRKLRQGFTKPHALTVESDHSDPSAGSRLFPSSGWL